MNCADSNLVLYFRIVLLLVLGSHDVELRRFGSGAILMATVLLTGNIFLSLLMESIVETASSTMRLARHVSIEKWSKQRRDLEKKAYKVEAHAES